VPDAAFRVRNVTPCGDSAAGTRSRPVNPSDTRSTRMNDQQNLGTVSTWQVKNYPDKLRKAIVERAALEKITVGELLTRITVAVMEAGWQVDGAVNPSDTRSTVDDLAVIERAVTAAVALAGAPEVPVAFRRRANRLLRESLPPRESRGKSGKPQLRISLSGMATNGADAEREKEAAHAE
jgi:hypothetical protein